MLGHLILVSLCICLLLTSHGLIHMNSERDGLRALQKKVKPLDITNSLTTIFKKWLSQSRGASWSLAKPSWKPRLLPHTNRWASPMAHKYQRHQEPEQCHSFSLLFLAEGSYLFPCPYTITYWSQIPLVKPADNHQQLFFCKHAAPGQEWFDGQQRADRVGVTGGKSSQDNGIFPLL